MVAAHEKLRCRRRCATAKRFRKQAGVSHKTQTAAARTPSSRTSECPPAGVQEDEGSSQNATSVHRTDSLLHVYIGATGLFHHNNPWLLTEGTTGGWMEIKPLRSDRSTKETPKGGPHSAGEVKGQRTGSKLMETLEEHHRQIGSHL